MPNIVIKLMVPIVFFALMVPSAYGMSLGVSNNGQSSNLNVQAGTSDSVSASFSVDGTSLSTLFAASGLKRFNHTYTYADPSNNVATLWVDVVNGRRIQFSVSPVTGKAEGSETLSVTSADKIDTGAIARTSEGDTAIVALNVISGSLTGYTNYANVNLISDTGEKTFVARQSASAISGSSITATSQAADVAGDSAQSSLTVTNGKISNFESYAGKDAGSSEWDNSNGNYSDASEELYANQYAGTMSGSSISATSKTTNATGLKLDSRLKVTDGQILGYQNNASISKRLYTSNETKSGGDIESQFNKQLWAGINAYNIGKIPVAPTKGKKTPPPPPEIKLAANASATDGDGNTTDLTTSASGGTITDYSISSGAYLDDYRTDYSNSHNSTSVHKSMGAGQHAQYINSTSNFNTYLSSTNADGDNADLEASVLQGTINGYESEAYLDQYDGRENYSDGGNYSWQDNGVHIYQYTGRIDADTFKTNSSATSSRGNTADMRTSLLDATVNYENEADVYSRESASSYSNGDTEFSADNDTYVDQYIYGNITASDFKTYMSATKAGGNTSELATSVLDGKFDGGYSSHAEVYSAADNYSTYYRYLYGDSYTSTGQDIYGNLNASDFETKASVTDANGNSANMRTSVLDGTISNYHGGASVGSYGYDYNYSDGSGYYYITGGLGAWQDIDAIKASDFETNASFTGEGITSADMVTSVLNGNISHYENSAGISIYGYGYKNSDGSGYYEYWDDRNADQHADFMNASAFDTSMSMIDSGGNSSNLVASLRNVTAYGYNSFSGVSLYKRGSSSGSGESLDDLMINRGARQDADKLIGSDFKTNASITDADGNYANMTASVINGILEGHNSGASVYRDIHLENHSDNSNYSEIHEGTGAGQWTDGIIIASDFDTSASITDADGNSAKMTTSALDGALESYYNNAEISLGRWETTNPDGSVYNSGGYSNKDASQGSMWYGSYINATDFATTLTASGITGSEATVSMHVTNASILNLYDSGARFNTGSGDEVEVEAYNFADSVSGSLINASGSSHDQYGNASSSTMDLVPKAGTTGNASISRHSQVSHVTYPGYNWDFNGSISWIRGYSATGDATFTATATNSTTTKTLDPTPYETTLDGTSFVDFGRIKEGTPVAYFASPDPDPWAYPWDY